MNTLVSESLADEMAAQEETSNETTTETVEDDANESVIIGRDWTVGFSFVNKSDDHEIAEDLEELNEGMRQIGFQQIGQGTLITAHLVTPEFGSAWAELLEQWVEDRDLEITVWLHDQEGSARLYHEFVATDAKIVPFDLDADDEAAMMVRVEWTLNKKETTMFNVVTDEIAESEDADPETETTSEE